MTLFRGDEHETPTRKRTAEGPRDPMLLVLGTVPHSVCWMQTAAKMAHAYGRKGGVHTVCRIEREGVCGGDGEVGGCVCHKNIFL